MRTILLSAVLGLAALSGCTKTEATSGTEKKAEEQFPTMTMDEVEKGVAANEVTPVDCNGERTRKKLGVVPGAIVISDEETFAESELPTDKGRKLVFYCSDAG
jgi:hypothetical protein